MLHLRVFTVVCFCIAMLAGCATAPPANPEDLCAIFKEKDGWFEDWYEDAKDAENRWEIPIPVMMSTMYQESKFRAKAKPPRRKILWIIPWKRPSSAYGYAQVLDSTWDVYRDDTGHGMADRDEFDDAIDFVGWYHDRSARQLGIPRGDAYKLYLAYHEGHGGYARGTFRKKSWLLDVAKKVDGRAKTYGTQLAKCRDELDGPWWWPF
ncbi:MAG: transglycosylase SLT domain-containing protein [Pseudomonadota bacterium]